MDDPAKVHPSVHPDYQILRELGRGGMGVVYLAQNTLMGRPEVLKVVSSELINRPGVLDRFLREIRSAAKLRHANIVTAYAAIRIGESLVLAMEYVEGYDLAKMVKTNGPLPVAHACNFVYQAALGLEHAHEHGMVHRDIKPANLILSRAGKKAVIKVLDFGLAKVTIEGQVDSGLTREGQMLGTPDYIAPEQIRDAQSADIRADIYSLGCTFYYLLTGGPPFRGDHLWDLYQAHFSMEAGPLNTVRPEVPVELAALVAKMMAKDPGRRFGTPGEVAQALVPFFKKTSESARSSTTETYALEEPEHTLKLAGRRTPRTNSGTNATPVSPRPVEQLAESTPSRVEPTTDPASLNSDQKRRKPRWLWPAVAAAVLLLGCAVTLGVILRFRSSKGPVEPVNALGLKEAVTVRPATVPEASPERPKDHTAAAPIAIAKNEIRPKTVPSVARHSSPASLTSSVGMTLRLIPAGEFMMGSRDEDAEAEKDEKPAHSVKISGFYMGIHEVTQAQYRELMGINPSYCSATGAGRTQLAGRPSDQHPVEYVTWFDAVRFCNALSERDGFLPFYEINGESVENVEIPNRKGPGYRLPTEAEWEYACRAGKDTKYSFGNEPALLSDYGWFDQNSVRMSHPVGQKQSNKFGLYDMHGNVFERCADLYDDSYYKRSPTEDPLKSAGSGGRVIRGGSWLREPRWSRSADRADCSPMGRYGDNGFRLALNVSEHIHVFARRATPTTLASKESTVRLSDQDPVPSANPSIEWSSPATRMAFALVKPGEFMMGSLDDDAAASGWEKPPHRVRITLPFYLGIYEVTQGQYQTVAGNNPSHFSSTGGGRELVGGQSTAQYPVENVSWIDSVRYCNALSKKDGLVGYYHIKGDKVECPDVKVTGYRLPTEAEWEYACRAGTNTRFQCGNSMWLLDRHAWIAGSAGGVVHLVGRKQPNPFGLFDMHGNVWEWCFDWADGAYYKQSPSDDPRGASKGTHRVMRGGSWENEPAQCRSANLNLGEPGARYPTVGFRVARALNAAELKAATQGANTVDAKMQTATRTPANKLAAAPAGAPVAKGSPQALLKARGLIRSGSHFVVASQIDALDKFQEIRPLFGQLDAAFRKYARALEVGYRLTVAEDEYNRLRFAVDENNTVLSKLPNGRNDNSAMKQQYEAQRIICADFTDQRDAAARMVDELRALQPAAGVKEELRNAFTAKWKEFLDAAPPVAKMLDRAKEEHRKLQNDPDVNEALAAIRRSTKAEVSLSPVKTLQNAIDTIKTASRAYSPETSVPKKKTKAVKR